MKVGVTGFGVVGKATADVLRRLGHDVVIHDVSSEAMAAAAAAGYGARYEAENVEVDFICVPETRLTDALSSLPPSPLAVIRSTVPPGTTDKLSEQFKRPLAYMPEFLREATSTWDAMNPQFIVIGTYDRDNGAMLASLFTPLMVQVLQVVPPVAEMVKISLNAYLHTLISFWNEIHNICERVGVPSHLVGKIAAQDPRVAAYGAVLHGDPVGGRCLPKDVAQLIEFAQTVGYSADLLKEVQGVNEKVMEPQVPARSNGHHAADDYSELIPRTGILHFGM
jgi:UDPglucose 6-dehydrogenase